MVICANPATVSCTPAIRTTRSCPITADELIE
jgi:hypothetical protein